jgi:Rrf2 family transcriptional regulator, nitric oxide-sensitive transcriptional repressor
MFRMQTDYALRTLIYLAHKGEQASVQEIATAYGISRDHLFKVVQQLVRLGYAASRPGRGGGIRLAKDAWTINCGAVVADFEGRNGLLPCVKDANYCVLEPGCVLRSALMRAEDALYGVLERLTVADLIRDNERHGTGGIYNLTIRGQTPVESPEAMASTSAMASASDAVSEP